VTEIAVVSKTTAPPCRRCPRPDCRWDPGAAYAIRAQRRGRRKVPRLTAVARSHWRGRFGS